MGALQTLIPKKWNRAAVLWSEFPKSLNLLGPLRIRSLDLNAALPDVLPKGLVKTRFFRFVGTADVGYGIRFPESCA
jgi:hypothetical protein